MDQARSAYYLQLSENSKIRYEEKIVKCAGVDPYTINEKELSVDRKDFPDISLWDIGNYLIFSMSAFTKKMLKAYKSSEGYSFFQSGFVLSVGSKRIGDLAIVKGKVKHSQRMNKESLQAWFVAKLDGEIICGHCTCTAGLSETCSHVAAICFAIECITKSATSVTEQLCKWNVPKFKENSMSKAREIKWAQKDYEKAVSKTESSFHSYYSTLPHLSDEVVLDFLNNLHSDGQEAAVRAVIYPDELCRVTKLKDDIFLCNMYCENYKNKSQYELVEIGLSSQLRISVEDSKEISRLTLPRLHSKIWVALRRGRVTGSNFKECCSANVQDPPVTLINRLINPANLFGNVPSIKYQKRNKKKAIKEYLKHYQSDHKNFQFEESGLTINSEYPYFAVSSDGMLSCDCHGRGCIEIKCLKELESGESFDILTSGSNNILYKVDSDYFLEPNHSYYYKTQMQINLSNSHYCDFVMWSPKEMMIIRVDADTEFWSRTKQLAMEFHQQIIMPELLGKFFTRQIVPKQISANDDYLELIGLEIEPMSLADEET